ncbi:interleukin-1 receptor accessory protein-like 1-A isoform X1, partial [Silurus meridionalis]
TSEFSALVEELGRKIGDSVTARLLSGGGFARTSSDNSSAGSQCATLDLSQLNVVLKSDEKEPPVFRGDGSGKCNIQEWVDMMQRYLRKRNIVTEQADEIISHLMGRAKDIVKVALRSNSALDSKHHPEIIYSILKQHFSEVSYSSMPLADFYSTLSKHGENPVDYWLRLNKAADIANECLGAQGRKMDNLNSEVAMMFVRNCPDTELARIFKLRPLESWTAKDVQELLDSFQREQKSRVSANVYSACQNAHISLQKCENVDIGPEAVLSCFKQGTTRPDKPKPEAVDRSGLNRMADMLAQLLEVLKNKEENKPAYVPFGKTRGKKGCSICSDTTHTTIDHCRSDHLCFKCHAAGHSKRDCKKQASTLRPVSGKLSHLHSERGSVGDSENSLNVDTDFEALFLSIKNICPDSQRVVFQNTQRVACSDTLFYIPVVLNDSVTVKAMLDTGSMACTLSDSVFSKLREHGVLDAVNEEDTDVVLIGCGGKRVFPRSLLELKLDVYGCTVIVPCLVVPGQGDDLILGTNVIKHIVHRLKSSDRYWELISAPSERNRECDEFLSMLAGVQRWKGRTVPDVVGTVKLNHAITLSPGQEHLVWGKLPAKSCGQLGSTVLVEPSRLHSATRKVLVGRVVTQLWGDGSIPLMLINPSNKPVTLRRNSKVADVYPCIALEDVGETESELPLRSTVQQSVVETDMSEDLRCRLRQRGLETIDLDSCEVSGSWKTKLCNLVLEYESVFLRHSLDCGEVSGFVHRIRLFDERPFRLPFRQVPPSQYQKLRVALNEMEERVVSCIVFHNYLCYYGFPECIHSDQGANFCSELIRHLFDFCGIKKSQTTLEPRPEHDWPQMLHTLTFLYNCTAHETTGFPPFYLMIGRTLRLPVDVIFKSVLRDDSSDSLPKYVASLDKVLKEALAVAEVNTGREQSHQARTYNRIHKGVNIEVGDRVLLANMSERGKRKLSDKWEGVVYTVVDRDPRTHIYKIKHPVSGQLKVVHRNLLLCVNFLPLCDVVGATDDESVFSVGDDVSDDGLLAFDNSVAMSGSPEVSGSVDASGPNVDKSCDSHDFSVIANVPPLSVIPGNTLSDHSVHQECTGQVNACNPNCAVSGTVDGAELSGRRSRFGRFLKPVNRLICSMKRQTLL